MSKIDKKIYDKLRYEGKKNSEEYKEYIKQRNNNDQVKLEKYNSFLKNEYSISLFDYNEMFIKQNGCCFIFGINQKDLKRKLAVDHCHKTGKIRSLLCILCNIGLGSFKDNLNNLEKAIEYLKSHKKEFNHKVIKRKNE